MTSVDMAHSLVPRGWAEPPPFSPNWSNSPAERQVHLLPTTTCCFWGAAYNHPLASQ
jgi:hypothetical protein